MLRHFRLQRGVSKLRPRQSTLGFGAPETSLERELKSMQERTLTQRSPGMGRLQIPKRQQLLGPEEMLERLRRAQKGNLPFTVSAISVAITLTFLFTLGRSRQAHPT